MKIYSLSITVLLITLLIISACNSNNSNTDQGEAMQELNAAQKAGYQGTPLALQSESFYLEFNKEDYARAIADNKLIVLNFYATWCPICASEQSQAIAAFNELDNENVVGFQVNYRDSDTDDFEALLAKNFGVPYQHTKVIIQNREQVLKSPESWNKERYLQEINNILQK